jgi:hypothetical protein
MNNIKTLAYFILIWAVLATCSNAHKKGYDWEDSYLRSQRGNIFQEWLQQQVVKKRSCTATYGVCSTDADCCASYSGICRRLPRLGVGICSAAAKNFSFAVYSSITQQTLNFLFNRSKLFE